MPNRLKIAIYVIDDDANQCASLEALFRRNKIENYTIFSNPVELLKALHEGVQICVLDYQLKNNAYNGITLMKTILKENSYCKCIIMSGYEDGKMVKAFLNLHAFAYLTKGEPNFSENLIKYINEAIALVKDTFGFYITLLEKMKIATEELKSVTNGET